MYKNTYEKKVLLTQTLFRLMELDRAIDCVIRDEAQNGIRACNFFFVILIHFFGLLMGVGGR